MRSWSITTSREFDKALRKLDHAVQRRVLACLGELAALEDPRIRGKPLIGDLDGYWRYRIGDFRLLVEIEEEVLTIIAIRIGHRSRIY